MMFDKFSITRDFKHRHRRATQNMRRVNSLSNCPRERERNEHIHRFITTKTPNEPNLGSNSTTGIASTVPRLRIIYDSKSRKGMNTGWTVGRRRGWGAYEGRFG
jgi:hypothetical protein